MHIWLKAVQEKQFAAFVHRAKSPDAKLKIQRRIDGEKKEIAAADTWSLCLMHETKPVLTVLY